MFRITTNLRFVSLETIQILCVMQYLNTIISRKFYRKLLTNLFHSWISDILLQAFATEYHLSHNNSIYSKRCSQISTQSGWDTVFHNSILYFQSTIVLPAQISASSYCFQKSLDPLKRASIWNKFFAKLSRIFWTTVSPSNRISVNGFLTRVMCGISPSSGTDQVKLEEYKSLKWEWKLIKL